MQLFEFPKKSLADYRICITIFKTIWKLDSNRKEVVWWSPWGKPSFFQRAENLTAINLKKGNRQPRELLVHLVDFKRSQIYDFRSSIVNMKDRDLTYERFSHCLRGREDSLICFSCVLFGKALWVGVFSAVVFLAVFFVSTVFFVSFWRPAFLFLELLSQQELGAIVSIADNANAPHHENFLFPRDRSVLEVLVFHWCANNVLFNFLN